MLFLHALIFFLLGISTAIPTSQITTQVSSGSSSEGEGSGPRRLRNGKIVKPTPQKLSKPNSASMANNGIESERAETVDGIWGTSASLPWDPERPPIRGGAGRYRAFYMQIEGGAITDVYPLPTGRKGAGLVFNNRRWKRVEKPGKDPIRYSWTSIPEKMRIFDGSTFPAGFLVTSLADSVSDPKAIRGKFRTNGADKGTLDIPIKMKPLWREDNDVAAAKSVNG